MRSLKTRARTRLRIRLRIRMRIRLRIRLRISLRIRLRIRLRIDNGSALHTTAHLLLTIVELKGKRHGHLGADELKLSLHIRNAPLHSPRPMGLLQGRGRTNRDNGIA